MTRNSSVTIIVLPLVSKYRKNKPAYWVKQVKCPSCGKDCWMPGGVSIEMVKKHKAMCTECVWGRR